MGVPGILDSFQTHDLSGGKFVPVLFGVLFLFDLIHSSTNYEQFFGCVHTAVRKGKMCKGFFTLFFAVMLREFPPTHTHPALNRAC